MNGASPGFKYSNARNRETETRFPGDIKWLWQHLSWHAVCCSQKSHRLSVLYISKTLEVLPVEHIPLPTIQYERRIHHPAVPARPSQHTRHSEQNCTRPPFPTPSYPWIVHHPYSCTQTQTLYYDTENASALADECYAPGEVTIDYTSMFGGKPLVVSNQEWAASAIGTMRPFDAKQHVLAGLVIEQLPQPAATATVPDHCEVITNVNGHIMRKAAATSESAAGGVGNMVHNGVSQRSVVAHLLLCRKGEHCFLINCSMSGPV